MKKLDGVILMLIGVVFVGLAILMKSGTVYSFLAISVVASKLSAWHEWQE